MHHLLAAHLFALGSGFKKKKKQQLELFSHLSCSDSYSAGEHGKGSLPKEFMCRDSLPVPHFHHHLHEPLEQSKVKLQFTSVECESRRDGYQVMQGDILDNPFASPLRIAGLPHHFSFKGLAIYFDHCIRITTSCSFIHRDDKQNESKK
mgnify:CR=1 FL=1